MGRDPDGDRWRPDGSRTEGEGERDGDLEWFCSGRGKKKDNGFQGNLERRGGRRVLKYILKERSVRLVCGTYLLNYKSIELK
jgi:hypothetical protein